MSHSASASLGSVKKYLINQQSFLRVCCMPPVFCPLLACFPKTSDKNKMGFYVLFRKFVELSR